MVNHANIKEIKYQPVSSAGSDQSDTDKSAIQLKDNRPSSIVQKKLVDSITAKASIQKKENKTGLPDNLKSGIENLSGISMDDVKVHYHSDKPAQLNAHAYAQGTDIHIAPGQEKHLPHEAWHVVQQKQGRVKPTMQLKGEPDNDSRSEQGDLIPVVQRVLLPGLKDKFGEELDTDYMYTIHNYIIESLSDNNENAIRSLIQQVENLDPKKLNEVKEIIRTLRIIIPQRPPRLLNPGPEPSAKADRGELKKPFDKIASGKKESPGLVAEHVPKDLIMGFTASSGDKQNGYYFDTAQKKEATSLQSRDAEVSLLQQIENWLREKRKRNPEYNVAEIFIRISKGPCTSCRSLIPLFRQRNPGSRIVIVYQQKERVEKDKAAKDSSQDLLSYGYQDAGALGEGNHYKVIPAIPVENPPKVKGYSTETLGRLYLNFKEQRKIVAEYIAALGAAFVSRAEDRPLLEDWLAKKVLFENAHSLSPEDQARINLIKRPAGGKDVEANAEVVLKVRRD